jgi:preprotein translocase subunit SecG
MSLPPVSLVQSESDDNGDIREPSASSSSWSVSESDVQTFMIKLSGILSNTFVLNVLFLEFFNVVAH